MLLLSGTRTDVSPGLSPSGSPLAMRRRNHSPSSLVLNKNPPSSAGDANNVQLQVGGSFCLIVVELI